MNTSLDLNDRTWNMLKPCWRDELPPLGGMVASDPLPITLDGEEGEEKNEGDDLEEEVIVTILGGETTGEGVSGLDLREHQ